MLFLTGAVILFAVLEPQPSDSSKHNEATKEGPAIAPSGAPPFHPNAVAKSLASAPGAIVCPDFASVQLMMQLYANHWEDAMQDALTKGQARILRGPSAPTPDPAAYDCSLLAPGTPVEARGGRGLLAGIFMVSARLPDGTVVHGVTHPGMLLLSAAYQRSCTLVDGNTVNVCP